MGIMRVLAAIYQLPKLKQNLKFEVEMLCDLLETKISSIKPADLVLRPKVPAGPEADIGTGVIRINPGLSIPPEVERLIYLAVHTAIKDTIQPVLDQPVTIAVVTTKELVLKDFATEPDENVMLQAAHLMVKQLAGSLTSVTFKEPLRVAVMTNIRTVLQQHLADPQRREIAVQTIVTENLDNLCKIIENAATSRAMQEINEALHPAVLARRNHRERAGLGQGLGPYVDIYFFSGRYPSALPDQLQPRVGGTLPQQRAVYEDFENLGVPPSNPPGRQEPSYYRSGGSAGDWRNGPQQRSRQEIMEAIAKVMTELQHAINSQTDDVTTIENLPPDHIIIKHIAHVPALVSLSSNSGELSMKLSKDIFNSILKTEEKLRRGTFLAILEGLTMLVPKNRVEITKWFITSEAGTKWDARILSGLISHRLLNMPRVDAYIVNILEAGQKPEGQNLVLLDSLKFIITKNLLQNGDIHRIDIPETLIALSKIAEQNKGAVFESVRGLLEKVKVASVNNKFGRTVDPKVKAIFEEWCVISNSANAKVHLEYLHKLQNRGYYGYGGTNKTEVTFYRLCTELAIGYYFEAEKEANAYAGGFPSTNGNDRPTRSYAAVDAFAKLVFLLIKYYPEKPALVQRILGVISEVMEADYRASDNGLKFNQRPYFRLIAGVLAECHAPDPALEMYHFHILIQFAEMFKTFRPSDYPAFALAWLELVSHRMFMPKLLLNEQGWTTMQLLLVELFTFLEPFLRTANLTPPIRLLYKGTLRVLLVLLHDFPEFLCDYHFSFCNHIPPSCIQMRNLILSAFPRSMRLPDPFTPNLKVDLLPEIKERPKILSDFTRALGALKQPLDTFLRTGRPQDWHHTLPSQLRLVDVSDAEIKRRGTSYNVTLINSLVLYIGRKAIEAAATQNPEVSPQAPMDVFRTLAHDLDTEGRYLFLNAIANQLRYPNNHTHYFSCVLLYLFSEANQSIIQEQVTRVLVERLIVHRPHPWGLLITFIELIKNPRYNFWRQSFTRCAPQIENLFISVSNSIAVNQGIKNTE